MASTSMRADEMTEWSWMGCPCCRQSHRSRRPRGRRSLHHRRPPHSGTPTQGYTLTREAAMVAFAKSWRRV